MKSKILLLVFAGFLFLTGYAGTDPDSVKQAKEELLKYVKFMDSVNKALKYETGTINLPCGIVQMNIPKGFKYLGKEQSKFVTENLWGNLSQEGIQGMLFPEKGDPFDDSSYAYIISYQATGHIKDADAKDINYDDLLKGMKKDDTEENTKRVAIGSPAMFTEGWAAKPYYDEQKKVLHWAIDLKVDGTEENTLNYKIIVLGRKGMLTMNAVAGISQLQAVKADVDKVLNMAEYTTGNKYSDFDSKVDDVAAWTVGGLVAGKILAKTAAGAGILKFLKFIIIGIVAAGGAIWKFITGRKKKAEEELVYQPEPTPAPDQPQSNL